jgi:hypothetical protein
MAAIVIFPAPEQPVIWTALIGVSSASPEGGANKFVIPRTRTNLRQRGMRL